MIDPVHHLGVLVSQRGKHRVLPARAGIDQLLATDSGVVDERGDFDIVVRALASLVIRAEAPGICLSIGGYGDGVVGATGRCLRFESCSRCQYMPSR